jgi:hypothetical protein
MYIETSKKIAVDNHPYGRTTTTMFSWTEFNPKKGYRIVSQTIDPKTGKLNRPKQGTYCPFIFRQTDGKEIKYIHFNLNGDDRLNEASKFCAQPEVFNLLTEQERKYLYESCILFSKVSMKAQVIYCGSEAKDLIPLFDSFVKAAVKGHKNPNENYFGEMVLPIEQIEALKKPNFNPFVVVPHSLEYTKAIGNNIE